MQQQLLSALGAVFASEGLEVGPVFVPHRRDLRIQFSPLSFELLELRLILPLHIARHGKEIFPRVVMHALELFHCSGVGGFEISDGVGIGSLKGV